MIIAYSLALPHITTASAHILVLLFFYRLFLQPNALHFAPRHPA